MMYIHLLKASAESLRRGRLCREHLRTRTSLLAMLDATAPTPEERAALRAELIKSLGLPEDASDELILQAVSDLLDVAAAEQTAAALGIPHEPIVKLGTEDAFTGECRRTLAENEARMQVERVARATGHRAFTNPAQAPDVVRLRVASGCKHTHPSPTCVQKYGGGCFGRCEID